MTHPQQPTRLPDDALAAPRQGDGHLGKSLQGSLPCVVCSYDLRGVTIRGVCPECGTAVRATILARVDPHAAELQPISPGRARIVSTGLVLWVAAMTLAVLVCWISAVGQGIDIWAEPGAMAGAALQRRAGIIAAVLIWLAGLGAILICRPHRGVPAWMTACVLVGAMLHVPLGLLAEHLGDVAARATGGLWVETYWEPWPDRTYARWAALLLALGIIALIRPMARLLVARSVTIRTGRVDRQTMVAMAAAIAVMFLGDGLGLAAVSSGSGLGILGLLGATLVLLGAVLLTVGLFSGLIDVIRIARAIMRPGPTLAQLVGVSSEAVPQPVASPSSPPQATP
ncbi:MAG: hypothetical protein MUE97_04510 [Phycisphaerales bacterium]|nr:hypothetical protein [Phycisphaerales bacterium]